MKKPQVDTPFAGSWADQQSKQSVALHHVPLPATFQEEQRLMNTMRKYPLARSLGQKYAESITR